MNGMNDNTNTLSGKVIRILDVVSGDSKRNEGEKWYRMEFVIETYAQYPRQVCFQIWGKDRIDQANLQLGEDVTVQFELSSREYNERWYTSAEARNIFKGGATQQANPYMQQPQYGGQPQYGQPQQSAPGQGLPNTNVNFGGNQGQQGPDDLPF